MVSVFVEFRGIFRYLDSARCFLRFLISIIHGVHYYLELPLSAFSKHIQSLKIIVIDSIYFLIKPKPQPFDRFG